MWDVAHGRMLWTRHTDYIAPNGVVFDPSGGLLAAVESPPSFDPTAPAALELLSAATGDRIGGAPVASFASAPSFSADGRVVVVGSLTPATPMVVFDVAAGRVVRTLDAPALRTAGGLVFSADGRIAVSTPNTGGGHIVVLDATTFAVLGALDADGDVAEVAVSPDGRLVAVDAIGQPTQLFDTTTGESFGDPIGRPLDGSACPPPTRCSRPPATWS